MLKQYEHDQIQKGNVNVVVDESAKIVLAGGNWLEREVIAKRIGEMITDELVCNSFQSTPTSNRSLPDDRISRWRSLVINV